MSDGREERKEQEERRKWNEEKDREEGIERDPDDKWRNVRA
jgi:hypothetical protein